MKTIKFIALATVAASVIASSAYAGGDRRMREIGDDNRAYFAGQGVKNSDQTAAQDADYQFNTRREERLAASSEAYFQKVGYKSGEVERFNAYSDVSQYPFPGSVLSAERGGYVYSSAVKR